MQEKYLRRVKVDEQKREETHHIWGHRVGKRYAEEKTNTFKHKISYKLTLRGTVSLHIVWL